MWNGIIGLWIGAGGESSVCGDEHLSSIKCEEFSGLPEEVLASPEDSAIWSWSASQKGFSR
jgi:hypothetical protein